MADTTISDLTAANSIDGANDYFPGDQQSSLTTKKWNRQTLLGVTGQPADISTAQNLTNKTLDNTNILTIRDDRFTLQDSGDVTRQAQFQLSGITAGQTRVLTVPDANLTIVGIATTQTLTNKTLTSPAITGGTIDNSTITVDAIGEHTAANGVTVDGLNIKDGKLNTNDSVITANITDTAVTPAKLQTGTGSGWSWSSWTPTFTNLTKGNGTTTAKYIQIGKTVFCRIVFTFGTTSSISGNVSASLPVTAVAWGNTSDGAPPIGRVRFEDNGVAGYLGTVQLTSTTLANFVLDNAASTYVQSTALSSTVPFTWGTSDELIAWFNFEAA